MKPGKIKMKIRTLILLFVTIPNQCSSIKGVSVADSSGVKPKGIRQNNQKSYFMSRLNSHFHNAVTKPTIESAYIINTMEIANDHLVRNNDNGNIDTKADNYDQHDINNNDIRNSDDMKDNNDLKVVKNDKKLKNNNVNNDIKNDKDVKDNDDNKVVKNDKKIKNNNDNKDIRNGGDIKDNNENKGINYVTGEKSNEGNKVIKNDRDEKNIIDNKGVKYENDVKEEEKLIKMIEKDDKNEKKLLLLPTLSSRPSSKPLLRTTFSPSPTLPLDSSLLISSSNPSFSPFSTQTLLPTALPTEYLLILPSQSPSILLSQYSTLVPFYEPSMTPSWAPTSDKSVEVFDEENTEHGVQSICSITTGTLSTGIESNILRITVTYQYLFTAVVGSDLRELLNYIDEYVQGVIFKKYVHCSGENSIRGLSWRNEIGAELPIGVSSLPHDKLAIDTCSLPAPGEFCEVIDGAVTLLYDNNSLISSSAAQKSLLQYLTLSANEGAFDKIHPDITRIAYLGFDYEPDREGIIIATVQEENQTSRRGGIGPYIGVMIACGCVLVFIFGAFFFIKNRRVKGSKPLECFETGKENTNIHEVDEISDFGEETVISNPVKSTLVGDIISENSNYSESDVVQTELTTLNDYYTAETIGSKACMDYYRTWSPYDHFKRGGSCTNMSEVDEALSS